MSILFHGGSKTFHIWNQDVSYVMMILPNGQLGQLYFGKRIHDREDFSDLLELAPRAMASCPWMGNKEFSLEHVKLELPSYGSGDFRAPAVEIRQGDGSRISDFQYASHRIEDGKPGLAGLPATYVEEASNAQTLVVELKDPLTGIKAELSYTVFTQGAALAKNVRYVNEGDQAVWLERAMSLCLDLPDSRYEWVQLSGAWARERHMVSRKLAPGIQSIGSMRGHSSHHHNPFLTLKRPCTTEDHGEAIGVSLVYSGNFLMQAEVDAHGSTRVLAGIHPDTFSWKLEPGEAFQTPEAVTVYSSEGLNGMSQAFHKLYQRCLARGEWRDKVRPILINNWEATYFDFDEEKLLEIAKKAASCGVEMFVLDDGWFGHRDSELAGLGDWVANKDRLPHGIAGLAKKIGQLGMKFGLWFEPEMVNLDSDLYRSHPDWKLEAPGRASCHGRNQFVLDFSRKEVVDAIYGMMADILQEADVSYIKWDMNRSMTEVFSKAIPADRQGEVFHRYILGVYDLYDRLTRNFPHILFESCASGGGRFDPGMLYYAPQAWTSDNTDAVERMKIQYGSSLCYPIGSIGSHVSMSPNHQMNRTTPLRTRANVAYFGTFGYELDLNRMSKEELEEVKEQIAFMKEYRSILQFGTFYRLKSPFEGNEMAWMVVSQDQKTAIVGWYRVLNQINGSFTRVKLKGLLEDTCYENSQDGARHYGDEWMHLGLRTSDVTAGEVPAGKEPSNDFESKIYVLKAVE
ncbi:alpha-galactosidase [Lachnospiraceae bacterium 29-84]